MQAGAGEFATLHLAKTPFSAYVLQTPDLPDRISVVQNNENGKDKVAPGCVPVLFNNNHTSDVSGLDEVGLMETGFGVRTTLAKCQRAATAAKDTRFV